MAQELRKFIDATYGTIADLGEETYMRYLGAATVQANYFAAPQYAEDAEAQLAERRDQVVRYDRAHGTLQAQLSALSATEKRLREALEKVKESNSFGEAYGIARAALAHPVEEVGNGITE